MHKHNHTGHFFNTAFQLAVRRIRWMLSVATILHWLSKTTRMWSMKQNEEHRSKISKRNGVTDIFADEDISSHVTNGNAGKAELLNERTEPEPPPSKGSHRLKFSKEFMEKYVPNRLESSGKMVILMELLQACQGVSDRVIIFSQSIPTLDIIDVSISKHNKYQRRRAKRINYLRIDGSTSQLDRFRHISQFNDLEEDVNVEKESIFVLETESSFLMCAGTHAMTIYVQIVSFWPDQTCLCISFVTIGTMEKKVYELQIRKEGVAKRIVDEKTTERKFMSSELQKYFIIEDFEDSLLHALGKVVDGKEAKTQALLHEDPVLENIVIECMTKVLLSPVKMEITRQITWLLRENGLLLGSSKKQCLKTICINSVHPMNKMNFCRYIDTSRWCIYCAAMEAISPSAVRMCWRLLVLLCLQKFNAFYASDRYQRELVDEDGKPIDRFLQVHYAEKIQPKLASDSDGGSGGFADMQQFSPE
ncbi:hypothetical protein PsorP6_015674 [Peronosclerospora sorghi]|uniref:Uncharacterized protein n=1 Tax=Peronosclerospora sorghi TaxID=230839 RepID=A0ACC0WP02_9STRA|nr:hypothetical protein PsorP6_015674 [Peronosclerospora sorghi]